MKNWFDHKMSAFEFMKIGFVDPFNNEIVFEGLQDKRITVETSMVSERSSFYVEFGSGVPAYRRDDGMIIAAAVTSDDFLCIAVWKDLDSVSNKMGSLADGSVVCEIREK
uniref:Cyclophil_like domain-containing protein n=1 Tax=Caenorhabditis tropicalis TaxID=1561998 RepID=A0A1I7V4D8_9PELO